uniref:PH domain-containing protein n=1 Tax=Phytophthora ramorum TaxID=164328 RepID=H3GQ44_PHYRM
MKRAEGGDAALLELSASNGSAFSTPQLLPGTPPMLAATSSSGGVLLLGKLMRRDRRLFTWKWRDFVLERSRLQYFSVKGTRKGDIPLTAHTPITIRMINEPKPFGFLLFIKDTKLTLAAATERERHQWIDVFCDVFHASVEQAPVDNKAERRARPTYLPIPDLGDEAVDQDAGASNLLVQQSSSMDSGDFVEVGGRSTPVMSHNLLDNEQGGNSERNSFGTADIPILESRMTYGPLKEIYSRITFPPSLANGDLLVGVGPVVRRMGWTDERILAVGIYIDPETATKELEKFHGRVAKSLHGDQQFYDYLLFNTTFRRSFVVTARKRVSKSVLTALLHDELTPRMGPTAAALRTFLGFIEKSLKKAESMVMRIHEDGRFEYRLRGQLYPPIASHALCKCIQALFFDSNSIQHDAKRGLVERLPSLWGGEVLDAQDEIFGSLHERIQGMESEDDDDSESEDDDDDDADYDDEDDSEAEDLFGAVEHGHYDTKRQAHESDETQESTEHLNEPGTANSAVAKPGKSSRSKRHSHIGPPKIQRQPSTQDEWAEYDEKELEMLRRESRTLMVHFSPMVDRDSNVLFNGDLVVDGSALLGTWSHQFSVPPDEYDEPYGSHQYRFTAGLYVDPGAISDSLLKYKGLSIGSIVQDTDYFHRFSSGKFQKHLVFKVDAKMKLRILLEYFDTCLRSLASSFEDVKKPLDSLVTLWDNAHPQEQQQQLELCPKDEARFSIGPEGNIVLRVKKRGSFKEEKKQNHSAASGASASSSSEETNVHSAGSTDSTATTTSRTGSTGENTLAHVSSFSSRANTEIELTLPPPPFHLALESLIFGFHAIDQSARTRLMERIPNLLDLARDDLVHTYHDEIQALRENYKRQKPENRVKVGYLSISFEKRKVQKNAEKGGAKEVTMVPSRWSKRWCRLDGTLFSYYSHKRSRKYRDMMELTRCEVVEITANSGADVARFACEKGESDSIRIAIVKPNGEILALRTETIYEGEEWLESLTDASKVRRHAGPADNWVAWDANFSQLRRRSSSTRDMLANRIGRSGSTASALNSERHSSVEHNTASIDRKGHGPTGEKNLATNIEGGDDDLDDEDVDEYDSEQDLVEKDGSLLAWVREDPRHAIIMLLLGLIVYLASVMHRNQPVLINSAELP